MNTTKESKQGIACAILCAVIWGVLPIYWKSLEPINPVLILFYRIVLAFIFTFILSIGIYKWKGIIEPLKRKGILPAFFLAGILISTNWGIYIWSVSNNFIIQTSIGYYIEPLFVSIFGIMLFHERLNRYKRTALILAGLSVLLLIINFRQVPTIALSLAISFSCYSALKKKFKLEAVLALLYETMFLVPFALAVIFYFELSGKGALAAAEPYQLGLLMLSGILTGIPLLLFAMAANRISLITLGLTEYISPSMALLLGIFLYKEPFDRVQFIAFVIIWLGLAIFTIGELVESGQLQNYLAKRRQKKLEYKYNKESKSIEDENEEH